MAYAKKTCHKCGIIKPQPEMFQENIKYNSGKSTTGIHKGTILGAFAGQKKSGENIRKALFNNNQRNYTRNKTVWVCGECSGRARSVSEGGGVGSIQASMPTLYRWFFQLISLCAGFSLFFSGILWIGAWNQMGFGVFLFLSMFTIFSVVSFNWARKKLS